MKHSLKIALIFCLSLGLGIYARNAEKTHGIKGTVLQVDNGYALISKRLNLTEAELQMSPDDWLSGNYNLILAGPVSGLEAGQEVKITVQQMNDSEYPLQATVRNFRLLD